MEKRWRLNQRQQLIFNFFLITFGGGKCLNAKIVGTLGVPVFEGSLSLHERGS